MADLTYPFDERARDELGGTLRHHVQVLADHSSWADPIVLDLVSGTLQYSENRYPFAVANLVCRVPDTQGTLDLLDGRDGVRIEIRLGYTYSNGVEDVQTVARLWLWERGVVRPDNTMSIEARSGEMRLIELTPLTSGEEHSFNSAADAGTSIEYLLYDFNVVDVSVLRDMRPATFVTGADSMALNRGDNVLQFITDITNRVDDGWVYEDGLGYWHVTNRVAVAGESAAILRTGVSGTLTRSETRLSLEEWYNAVFVTYSWYDGEQRTATGWAAVTSGDYSIYGDAGRRVMKQTYNFTGTTSQAQSAADSLLRRSITRGRSMSLEAANAAYWLRPGMTVTVQLPTGPQERHLVSEVQFQLDGSGRMNLNTRVPVDVVISTGE